MKTKPIEPLLTIIIALKTCMLWQCMVKRSILARIKFLGCNLSG
jgi:hypothetical protein